MGSSSSRLPPQIDKKKATRTQPQKASHRVGRPHHGRKSTMYSSNRRSMSSAPCRSDGGYFVPVSEAENARSQFYDHEKLLESFKRWGSTPIEVQQEIERCVRDDEIIRRRGQTYNDHRARKVDSHDDEYHDALTRSLKHRLGSISW